MPIVLTGDVHHRMPSADRRHFAETESALGVEYARIALRHELKTTLFLTGRAVVEDGDDAKPLRSMPNVELGGHGWDAFQPARLYAVLHRLTGSSHGLGVHQRLWTIGRTCAALERFTGTQVRSWRNHAYRHDGRTPGLLAAAGIEVWSDEVSPLLSAPYRHADGVTVLPLNTLPDHEHMFHGDLTPEAARETARSEVYSPDEWLDRVCNQVETIVGGGGVATILAHPLCMKVVDDWATFDRLCSFLARFPSVFARETALPHA